MFCYIDINDIDTEMDYTAGLEIKFFSREPDSIFKSYLKVFCIETSIFFCSLEKFEGAAGEFEEALGSPQPLILSPALQGNDCLLGNCRFDEILQFSKPRI